MSAELLTFRQLDREWARFDAAVAATPEIDRYCSSADWVLPAQEAFAPASESLVLRTETGYVAMMIVGSRGGSRLAAPLEAAWGLASPILGPDPDEVLASLAEWLGEPPLARTLLYLSGIVPEGRAHLALRERFFLSDALATCQRIAARIDDGFDGFLARRSANFRGSMRKTIRAAERAHVEYEYLPHLAPEETPRVYARILDLERRSRKGLGGIGFDQEPSRTFYARMLARLAARGALRVLFVRRGARDLAFVFGGLFGALFRGLQVSFDDEHGRESPGVLAHAAIIRRLADEGVGVYDLGTDMEYKHRWGELTFTTATFVAH